MPLLSFSVFKEKLISGEKTQTIRQIRKRPIEKGDILYCWWKSRTKERQKLFEANCTEIIPIKINAWTNTVILNGKPLTEEAIKELAIADGFESCVHFYDFFVDKFSGVVIKWEKLEDSKPDPEWDYYEDWEMINKIIRQAEKAKRIMLRPEAKFENDDINIQVKKHLDKIESIIEELKEVEFKSKPIIL